MDQRDCKKYSGAGAWPDGGCAGYLFSSGSTDCSGARRTSFYTEGADRKLSDWMPGRVPGGCSSWEKFRRFYDRPSGGGYAGIRRALGYDRSQ